MSAIFMPLNVCFNYLLKNIHFHIKMTFIIRITLDLDL